jgi:hypothetical protein
VTTTPGELVGLPDGGPTSVPMVKAWLAITDVRSDDQLEPIVAAVNNSVRSWRISELAVGAEEWPARIAHGATMLAARLFRRRNSPGGVESFGTDGAVYVSRNDPDFALLLQLGNYQRPQVG